MKPGRPTGHIRAYWLSWCEDGVTSYFCLDPKGNLEKVNGDFMIHHQRQAGTHQLPKKAAPTEGSVDIQFPYIDELIPTFPALPNAIDHALDPIPDMDEKMWRAEYELPIDFPIGMTDFQSLCL